MSVIREETSNNIRIYMTNKLYLTYLMKMNIDIRRSLQQPTKMNWPCYIILKNRDITRLIIEF